MLFNCQWAKARQHTGAILECSVVTYLAINEWGWVGCKELCRSRRMLSTSDIFCVFLHLFRAVLVRNSATSSSGSRERHFLVHSWIIASRPRVETRLIDGPFPMQPRFQSNITSFQMKCTIKSMVYCSNRPNMVSASWSLKRGAHRKKF